MENINNEILNSDNTGVNLYTDRLIWSDGHMSYLELIFIWDLDYYNENGYYMDYADTTFKWCGICWIEIDK